METIFRTVQPSSPEKPSARRYHSGFSCFLSADALMKVKCPFEKSQVTSQVLMIFGGQGPKTLFHDLWLFDIGEKRWTCLDLESDRPAARFGHKFIEVPNQSKAFLIGGQLLKESANEFFWEFDLKTMRFRPVVLPVQPRSRYHHSVVYCQARNALILIGGIEASSEFYPEAKVQKRRQVFLDDIWEFSLEQQQWKKWNLKVSQPRAGCALIVTPGEVEPSTNPSNEGPECNLFILGGFTATKESDTSPLLVKPLCDVLCINLHSDSPFFDVVSDPSTADGDAELNTGQHEKGKRGLSLLVDEWMSRPLSYSTENDGRLYLNGMSSYYLFHMNQNETSTSNQHGPLQQMSQFHLFQVGVNTISWGSIDLWQACDAPVSTGTSAQGQFLRRYGHIFVRVQASGLPKEDSKPDENTTDGGWLIHGGCGSMYLDDLVFIESL